MSLYLSTQSEDYHYKEFYSLSFAVLNSILVVYVLVSALPTHWKFRFVLFLNFDVATSVRGSLVDCFCCHRQKQIPYRGIQWSQ